MTALPSFLTHVMLYELHQTKVPQFIPRLKDDGLSWGFCRKTLFIQGERKEKNEQKDGQHIWIEQSYGSFKRSIGLPNNINIDTLEATYKDGILNVKINKIPEEKPKKIKIKNN